MTRSIGGKTMNIGVRHGLLDAKHTHAMGKAILLFEWLVSRQTKENGLVLGGKPITYADIAADTGWAARTLRRWMGKLVEKQYVSLKYSVYSRMVIHVLNQKKFESLQLPLGFEAASPGPKVADSRRPEVAHIPARSGRLNHRAERSRKNRTILQRKMLPLVPSSRCPRWVHSPRLWRDYEADASSDDGKSADGSREGVGD